MLLGRANATRELETAQRLRGWRLPASPIVERLRVHDPYMVCPDVEAYLAAEAEAASEYRKPREWSRRVLHNIAGASAFSSDDTVQYADEIWGRGGRSIWCARARDRAAESSPAPQRLPRPARAGLRHTIDVPKHALNRTCCRVCAGVSCVLMM